MGLGAWYVGEGTPYDEVRRLRDQAAERLEKFLEMSPDLPEEEKSRIEDKLFDLA